VLGLDCEQHDVPGADRDLTDRRHRRAAHRRIEVRCPHPQTTSRDGGEMVAPRDQGDIFAGMCEEATDDTSHGTSSDDDPPHRCHVYSVTCLVSGTHPTRIRAIPVGSLVGMSEKPVTGSFPVKRGLAEMLKGGVIMDVVTPEQAKIAEDAGACA